MPDGGVGEGWLETAFKKAERKKQKKKQTNKQHFTGLANVSVLPKDFYV